MPCDPLTRPQSSLSSRWPAMRHGLRESRLGPIFNSLVTMPSPGELLEEYYAIKRPACNEGGADADCALAAPPPPRQDREVFGELLDGPVVISLSPVISDGVTYHGRAAVLVPIYGEGEKPGLGGTVVEFKSQDQGSASTGVKLGYFFGEDAEPILLRGAQDIVLNDLRGRELELIISWPGYQSERCIIYVNSEDGGPLTRFDLGKQITLAYGFFFFNIERDGLLPSAPSSSFYNVALHQGQNRRWNTPGIQLSQLRLVRFRSAISGSWFAEVELVL